MQEILNRPGRGVTAYQGMMNKKVQMKLDHINHGSNSQTLKDRADIERDRQYKEKLKRNAENSNTRRHTFTVNDYVLLKQTKKNKWSTEFEPAFYIVYKIEGSLISTRRITDGHKTCWDTSQFRLANLLMDEHGLQASNGDHTASPEHARDDRQDRLLQRTRPHWNEVNIDAPDDMGENKQASSQGRTQRDMWEPAYLRDYVHWAGDREPCDKDCDYACDSDYDEKIDERDS